MTTLLSLLSRGYFPRELPTAFTTEKYATIVSSSTIPLSFSDKKVVKATKLAQHSLAKGGHDRRLLSIPNPISQYNLCSAFVANWSEVEQLTKRSLLSKSTPSVMLNGTRAILPSFNHDDLPFFRLETRAKSKFILQTDVSKCYQSIYTHSIPWAIHTKAFAKANHETTHVRVM